jgi:ATP-dependent Lon protease
MFASEDIYLLPENFSGTVRLFPLPNLVLFPHVLQPLHIFEPRYRELMEEALATDKLIAMAVLAPGWETDYESRPPLHPVACLGRIATYTRLKDGKFNVLLAGLKRVGLVHELDNGKLFREAQVMLCDDVFPAESAARRPALHRRLLEGLKRILPRLPDALEQLEQLLSNETSLAMLTDIVGYTFDFELAFKEQLLRERNVDRRAELIVEQLDRMARPGTTLAGTFPPGFSVN